MILRLKLRGMRIHTPDIEIEKRENKFGIIYLPTGKILLPFEYQNIMINSGAIHNFFVV